MKKIFAAAALLFAMIACGGAHNDHSLEGTTWKLTQMEGIPASAINSEADAFTLEFNAADTMVAGRTNCNRFFGKYSLKGRKLDFAHMGMTRMACPDMQYEDAFVRMLGQVNRYEIKNRELTLYNDHKSLAVFHAASAVNNNGKDGYRNDRDGRRHDDRDHRDRHDGRDRNGNGATGTNGTNGTNGAGTNGTGTTGNGATATGTNGTTGNGMSGNGANNN